MSNKQTTRKSTAKIARDFLARVPGAYLFPIRAGMKSPPCFAGNLELATNDPAEIDRLAMAWPGCNWGVSLKKSKLIVPDVDMKEAKVGAATLDNLELTYGELPATLRVRTPSGGLHIYFTETPTARHVMRVSGFGQDVDSTNYVLIPGCVLDGSGKGDVAGTYTIINDAPIAAAPEWFAEVLGAVESVADADQTPVVEQDTSPIRARCIDYLKTDAPPAILGKNGEKVTLQVAAMLKDMGASKSLAIELMAEIYNGRCDPPWSFFDGPTADRMDVKIGNAWKYLTQNAPGSSSPEAAGFDDPAEPLTGADAANAAKGERQQAAEKAAGKETWDSIKSGWVYVGQQKQFVRLSDGKMWDVDAFEKQFGYVKDGMRGGASNNAPTSLTKVIFNCRPGQGLRTFDSFVFMPGQPEDYCGDFNQWRPSDVVPAKGPTDLWDAHLAYLFPNESDRDLVLNWMAWVFQNPTLHPNHSLMVQGQIQGTGKSLLPQVLAKLVSAIPATPLSQRTLELDHNAWVLRTRLAIIEVRAANKKLSDILHDLITGPMAHVDMKSAHDFDIPNVMAFWLEANPLAAMAGLDNSDRRHAIVSTDQPGKVLQPREPAYYAKLYGVNGVGGLINDPAALAAIAFMLKTRDLKGYSGQGRAPSTDAKKAVMRASADGFERWMVEHHDDAPLTYSLVTIEEVLTAMPNDLRDTKGARERVATILAGPEFHGENVGKVRIGAKTIRLWAINRTAGAASVRDTLTPATLAKMYRREHMTPDAAAIAEQEAAAELAQGDFADETA